MSIVGSSFKCRETDYLMDITRNRTIKNKLKEEIAYVENIRKLNRF